MNYRRRFYDNIYGFIWLTEFEDKIIKSPYFQRLRHISQMGTVNYIFPSAEHTRFSHSLGVLHITQKILSNINEQLKKDKKEELSFRPIEIEFLRLTALLHDIGHYPCSHAIEEVYQKHIKRDGEYSNVVDLYEDEKFNGHHERLGSHIIKTIFGKEINDYFGKKLRSVKINNPALEMGNLVCGDSNIDVYARLINSDLDADRLDYLIRDSEFMGSRYGQIDIEQLIRSIRLIEISDERAIVIDKKGLISLENYMLSRYLSRSLLITNKTIASFEILLQTAFELLLMEKMDDEKKNYTNDEDPDFKNFTESYPYTHRNILATSTTPKFLEFTDHFIFDAIYQASQRDNDSKLKRISSMLVNRDPLREIKEIRYVNNANIKRMHPSIEKLKQINEESGVYKKLMNVLWIDNDEWVFYKCGDVSIIKLPKVIETEEGRIQDFSRMLMLNNFYNDEKSYLYRDPLSIISRISAVRNEACWVFTTSGYEEKVNRELTSILESIPTEEPEIRLDLFDEIARRSGCSRQEVAEIQENALSYLVLTDQGKNLFQEFLRIMEEEF